MAYMRQEQETSIVWDEEEKVARIYTASPGSMRKLDRLCEAFPGGIPEGLGGEGRGREGHVGQVSDRVQAGEVFQTGQRGHEGTWKADCRVGGKTACGSRTVGFGIARQEKRRLLGARVLG